MNLILAVLCFTHVNFTLALLKGNSLLHVIYMKQHTVYVKYI